MSSESRDQNVRRSNVVVEVILLFLLFSSLTILLLGAIMVFTIISLESEGRGRDNLSALDPFVFSSTGHLQVLAIFCIPLILLIVAGIGLRHILLRPDPPPDPLWEPAAREDHQPESPP